MRLWEETAVARALGRFHTPEGCINYLCHEVGVDPGVEQVSKGANIRLDYLREHLVPRPESEETLTLLKTSGYKIGLISDCSPETPLLWPNLPLAPLIDVAIFSSEVGIKKPDPGVYELACTQLYVAAERCLYVGDGASDELAGAARVGMEPIRIRVPYERRPDDALSWSGAEISALTQVFEHLT